MYNKNTLQLQYKYNNITIHYDKIKFLKFQISYETRQLWVFLAYICLIYNKYCSLLYKICLNWLQFWVFNENSNMFKNTQIKWFQTTKKQLRKFFLLSCQTGLNNKTKVQTFSMKINNNHIKQPTQKIN